MDFIRNVDVEAVVSYGAPWIFDGLLSSFFDTFFDISDDESGMAVNILSKTRVEATNR